MRQPPVELGHRAGEVGGGEAEAGEDFAGAGGGAIGVDLGQAEVDVGHPLGGGGVQFGVERLQLRVGGEDGVRAG